MTSAPGRNPWWWIPSLYFAQGIPSVLVMTVSVVMYKNLGLSNEDIAIYTSWLYLPWVIKPLWSPLVDVFRSKRWWVLSMQFFMGIGLAVIALAMQSDQFLYFSLIGFWILAFSSATHDIAADGYYMLALSPHDQTWFVGIRSLAYRLAMIFGQGIIVILAGTLITRWGSAAAAWQTVLMLLAGVFLAVACFHRVAMPAVSEDEADSSSTVSSVFAEAWNAFASFFRKPHIATIMSFLLLYRFAEAQLAKIAQPFLLDGADVGGLGLKTEAVGTIYGTFGVIALVAGGLSGAYLAAQKGLKFWLPAMVIAINLPNIVYLLLAYYRPDTVMPVYLAVTCEQFGYGFGFTAYMLFMLYVAQGEHETAHYAICTGFMALGMMLPGRISGQIQEALGYQGFFLWIMVATIPSFVATMMISLDANFGRRQDDVDSSDRIEG